jgi:hypothetical protein
LATMLRDDNFSLQSACYVIADYQAVVTGRGDHPYSLQEALASARAAFQRPARTPAKKAALCQTLQR